MGAQKKSSVRGEGGGCSCGRKTLRHGPCRIGSHTHTSLITPTTRDGHARSRDVLLGGRHRPSHVFGAGSPCWARTGAPGHGGGGGGLRTPRLRNCPPVYRTTLKSSHIPMPHQMPRSRGVHQPLRRWPRRGLPTSSTPAVAGFGTSGFCFSAAHSASRARQRASNSAQRSSTSSFCRRSLRTCSSSCRALLSC